MLCRHKRSLLNLMSGLSHLLPWWHPTKAGSSPTLVAPHKGWLISRLNCTPQRLAHLSPWLDPTKASSSPTLVAPHKSWLISRLNCTPQRLDHLLPRWHPTNWGLGEKTYVHPSSHEKEKDEKDKENIDQNKDPKMRKGSKHIKSLR